MPRLLQILIIFCISCLINGCGDKNPSPKYLDADKGSVSRSYMAPPSYGSHTSTYGADCDSGHWISSVNKDGEVVILEDGSVWIVDPVDQIDSALWLPTSDIVACDDKLINTDDDEAVTARRVR